MVTALVFAFIVLLLGVIVLGYVCKNLLNKVEIYEEKIIEYENEIIKFEDYYKKVLEAIDYSDITLQKVDARGNFKSDDEIGYFFNLLKDLQLLLNSFHPDKYKSLIKDKEQDVFESLKNSTPENIKDKIVAKRKIPQ